MPILLHLVEFAPCPKLGFFFFFWDLLVSDLYEVCLLWKFGWHVKQLIGNSLFLSYLFSLQIVLPPHLERIREKLAENIHELWVMNKIELGWQYGPVCTLQPNFLLIALYDSVHWFQCTNGTAFFIIPPKISKVFLHLPTKSMWKPTALGHFWTKILVLKLFGSEIFSLTVSTESTQWVFHLLFVLGARCSTDWWS